MPGEMRGKLVGFATERVGIAKRVAEAVVERVTKGGPVLSEVAVGPVPIPLPIGAFWGKVRVDRIANRRRLLGM